MRLRFPHPLCIGLSAALALSAGPCAAQESLSLAAAQQIALARSRDLSGKEAAATAAREMSVAASRLPDPMLQLGVENLPISGGDRFSLTGDAMTMRRIGLAQEFTHADKRKASAARYQREAEKQMAEREASAADIERQTAAAWLERHYAEQAMRVLEEQIATAQAQIKAVESSYRAGRGTQADVIAAHTIAAELEDRRIEQSRRIARSKHVLSRWVGERGQTALAQPPGLDAIRLSTGELPHELSRHPALVALQKRHEVALAEANLARANRKSDWTVEVNYQQRGSAYVNMVSVGVSIPLQWDQRHRQDREWAAKLALAEEAQSQHEEALRAHMAEVQALLTDWRSLRARAARYRGELVPLARERARATLASYAGGKASLADLTEARRAELETTLRTIELDAAAAQLWAQLNFLVPSERHDGLPAGTHAEQGTAR